MLGFVFQKIKSKKWMILCLLLGNLLMVSIASAVPMYSQASLQRALTRNLGDYLTETGQHPGTIIASAELKSDVVDKQVAAHEKFMQAKAILDRTLQELNVPAELYFTHYNKTAVKAVPDVVIDGGKDTITFTLNAYSGVEDHIKIINGRMFSTEIDGSVIEVIVNQRTFVDRQMFLNQEFELPNRKDENGNLYRLRVVGTFENSTQQDPYWITSPNLDNDACVMDAAIFEKLYTNPQKLSGGYSLKWNAVLDYTAFEGNQVEDYLQTIKAAQKQMEALGVKTTFNFQSTMEQFVPEQQKLNATILVLLAPIFVLLAVFIFMVSKQMLEMEENEIAVYKSRGAGKGQILSIYLLQSLCIAAVSLVGGVALGMLMCQLLGASNSFLELVHRTALPVKLVPMVWLIAACASFFSVCTMVLPVFRYAKVNIVDHKRSKNRVNKRPWWQAFYLDIVLLAVAAYGMYQYNGQQDYLSQRVLNGESMDPLLYLCSSLFMIGCALVVLRILPLLVKIIFQIGKRWWSPALYTSFLRIIRTRSNQGFLMVLLVLTVSMGIFNAHTARTINANAEDKIRYVAGADLVVQEVWERSDNQLTETADGTASTNQTDSKPTYSEPNFEKYLAMDGVKSATKVLYNDRINVTLKQGTLNKVTLMGIHTKEFGQTAWFKESLLPYHYHEYLNALSTNPNAVLVSSNFREIYGYEVGDVLQYADNDYGTVRGVIYAFVEYWPSYAPVTYAKGEDGTYQETENFLIVANLAQLQSSWGVTPYQVWIDAEGSTQFLYDYAQENEIKYQLFRDASAELLDKKNDPVFQGTNGILTIGFISILLLCSIGFLIYWILSIRSRTLQFGIFRAMGMSMREIFTMLVNEQFFITGISIGAGILVGILNSQFFVKLIQIAYSSADQVIPIEIITDSGDYVRLFAVIGFAILLCMVVLGVLISRIKITQALKLGED